MIDIHISNIRRILICKYNLQICLGILWFIFYTGLLAKLSIRGWYILLVVSSKDIEENSKFHQSFSLIWDIHFFLLRKNINGRVSTVNEFMMCW